jgi:hypothetical protein
MYIYSHFYANQSHNTIDFNDIARISCLIPQIEMPDTVISPPFVCDHISSWRARSSPGRAMKGWLQIPTPESSLPSKLSTTISVGHPVLYMRSFAPADQPEKDNQPSDHTAGMRCNRESVTMQGVFRRDDTLRLVETRYSVGLNIFLNHASSHGLPFGHFSLVAVADWRQKYERGAERSKILDAGDGCDRISFGAIRKSGFEEFDIRPAGPYTGYSMFQIQVCAFTSAWKMDWMQTIDEVDRLVSIQVRMQRDPIL